MSETLDWDGGSFVPDYTVDDLLAWLRGRGHAVDANIWQDAEDGVRVILDKCANYQEFDAPTLLAALEATVRCVASES